MTSPLQNPVLQGLEMFRQSVQDIAQNRAIEGARQQVEAIRQADASDEEKLRATEDLGKRFALDAIGSGMSHQDTADLLARIAPPPKLYQTPEQAVLNAPEGSQARTRGEDLITQRNAERMAEIDSKSAGAMATAGVKARAAAKREFEKDAKDLRTFVEKSDGYKNYSTALDAQKNILSAVENPSGYGDLTAMFAFMRALDPTSVVREGEQTLFRKTASLPQSVANAMNALMTGETLQPKQRKEVAAVIGRLVQAKKTAYDRVYARAHAKATRLEIPEDEWDPFKVNMPAPEAAGTTPAAAAAPAAASTLRSYLE